MEGVIFVTFVLIVSNMAIAYMLLGTLYILVLTFCAYSVFALRSAAPWVPTGKKRIERMLTLAKVAKGDLVIDVGSGDGRMVEAAVKRGAVAIGIEINPTLHWYSRLRARIKRLKRASFIRTDLWKYSLGKADVVLLFFINSKMAKLEKKLMGELQPGTRVVSYIFRFPTWQHAKKDGMLYLYIV